MRIINVYTHLFILLICVSFNSYSQDEGMTLLEDSDDTLIKFENHFFEALKYKAIGNNSRAIIELEKCQQIFPNDKSIDFEFSKNYFVLKKYIEAELYIDKALKEEPENYWFLNHAKKVQLRQYNYRKAIELQKKIISQNPKVTEDLVLIYIQAKENDKAKKLLEDLESKGMTSFKLSRYKDIITNDNTPKVTKQKVVLTENTPLEELKKAFIKDKQFDILKEILLKEEAIQNIEGLLDYSQQGLELFPAQPFTYLMNGKALISHKKYNSAIDVLITGIDFVVDEKDMTIQFYQQLALAYEALGKKNKAKNYSKLVQELRK